MLAAERAIQTDGFRKTATSGPTDGGIGFESSRWQARDLASCVSEGRFYVACIAQFQRGKSTLINALVSDAVLPIGFTPVTIGKNWSIPFRDWLRNPDGS